MSSILRIHRFANTARSHIVDSFAEQLTCTTPTGTDQACCSSNFIFWMWKTFFYKSNSSTYWNNTRNKWQKYHSIYQICLLNLISYSGPSYMHMHECNIGSYFSFTDECMSPAQFLHTSLNRIFLFLHLYFARILILILDFNLNYLFIIFSKTGKWYRNTISIQKAATFKSFKKFLNATI